LNEAPNRITRNVLSPCREDATTGVRQGLIKKGQRLKEYGHVIFRTRHAQEGLVTMEIGTEVGPRQLQILSPQPDKSFQVGNLEEFFVSRHPEQIPPKAESHRGVNEANSLTPPPGEASR
jgi:hypothetical protein